MDLIKWTWKDTLSAVGFLAAAFLIIVIWTFISAKIDDIRKKHADPTKKGGKEMSQEELIRKYEKTKDYHKRCELVKKINDPEFLAKIALNDPYTSALCQAIVKIDDQKLLTGIAENDGDPLVRFEAIGKVTDQTLLEKIAAHDDTNFVREIAAERITDSRLLRNIASGQDEAAATGAIRVIEDKAFLEQFSNSEFALNMLIFS